MSNFPNQNMPPEQPFSQSTAAPLPGSSAQILRPYSPAKRTAYGIMWAFWSVAFLVGGFTAVTTNVLAGLLTLALAVLAIRYDYRIWTYQAKHLWFLIIF